MGLKFKKNATNLNGFLENIAAQNIFFLLKISSEMTHSSFCISSSRREITGKLLNNSLVLLWLKKT